MGTYEKRGKNSWRIATQVKVGSAWEWVRMTLKMDPSLPEDVQERDARRELALLEARLASQDRSMTLRDWSREWMEKHLTDSSPVTVAGYRYLLDSRILPQLGDKFLADLTPAVLTDWMITVRNSPRKTTRLPDNQLKRPRRKGEKLAPPSKQARPLSAKTLLNYYTCMSSMLAAAVRMGYLDHNPMDRVQRPRQAKHKRKISFSEEKAVRLLRDIMALPDEARCYRTAVLLALLCGCRLGEVTGIKYTDIDLQARTLTVSRALKYTPETGSFEDVPKTEAGARVISLPAAVAAYLDQQAKLDAWAESDYAIDAAMTGEPTRWVGQQRWVVHNRFGAQMNKDSPSKWFRKFADRSGYGGIRFHDLRHAHASLLVARGIDIAAVAARMGHSDATVTLSTYTHPFATHDALAASSLDELLLQAAPQLAPDPGETSAADLAEGAGADPAGS